MRSPRSLMALLASAGLLAPQSALAFDAHQIQVSAGQAELGSPLVTVHPWTAPRGTLATALTYEYARNPLEQQLVLDATGETFDVPLVAGLNVLNLGFSYALNDRLALSAGVPLFLRQMRVQDFEDPDLPVNSLGPSLGDLVVAAPIRILGGPTGLAVSITPELSLPTGPQARDLGDKGPGLGAVAAVGYSNERFRASVNLGARAVAGDEAAEGSLDADTQLTGVLGAAVSAKVNSRVGVGAELWAHPAVTASGENKAFPAEAIYHVDVQTTERLMVTLGGAHGAGPDGAGMSTWRAFAGVTFQRRPSDEPVDVVPVVKTQETPYDLLVTAKDDEGNGVDANLTVRGEGAEYTAELGRDGEAVVQLAPGEWEVVLEAEGYGVQKRTMVLDEDRFIAPTIDAVLQDDEGDGQVDLVLEDAENNGVDGAQVSIDGNVYGNTSTEGTLTVGGLTEGDHAVKIDAEDFEDTDTFIVTAAPQAEETNVVLERPPGSVKVIVRTDEGQVVPSLVRFVGPEQLDPEPIGPTGEKVFILDDGDWTVVVSSEEYGLQQREVRVDSLRKVLQVVDVVLTPDLGEAELHLSVIDPDGNPVQGARVGLNGEHRGSTSNGGTLVLAGLKPGEVSLSLEGERFLPEPEVQLELVDGVREVLVTMDWKPGSLQVVTRGRGEVPVDALVRFEGPDSIPPTPVGPDGEGFFELTPGSWTIAVSAESLGLQERQVSIEADETSLVLISAVLREERGDAVLAISVVDPEGQPIDGARVALDGEPVGTTSTGGTLVLEGLAPGDSVLEVAGVVHEYTIVDPLSMDEGDNDVELVLAWLAGTVSVITQGPDGPVDALVRAYGPAIMAPVRTGVEGDRVLYLEPGDWTVVASSDALGIEQEEVLVEAGQESLVPIEFSLQTLEEDEATFVLSVVDADGNPVQGATVRVGEQEFTTPDGGSIVLEDAERGTSTVSVEAQGFKPLSDEITVVGGNQTRSLSLEWVPMPVTLTVKTDKGEPLVADVKWVGPVKVEDAQTGEDGSGSFELRPGVWTVVAQADDLGAGRAEITVQPGIEPEAVVIELKDSRVEVVEGEVKILEQVFFDTGRATIRPESYAVLDEVANVLLLNPQITKVEVQGHTDNVGTDDTNLRLSQRRAQAVRNYLISKGVKRSRLEAKGYGNSAPIATNDTEDGRGQNRRVQFEIVETKTE